MIHSKSWVKALRSAKEFNLQPFTVIEGRIPKDLNGSLYRNGAAKFERGDQTLGHWFGGDGAMLAVHFREGSVSGAYQFVKTDTFLEEEKLNKFIYSAFGNRGSRGFFEEIFKRKSKNPANTSCLPLKDKVLALCEGGKPWALNPDTLETIGEDSLSILSGDMSYSAHPKVDPDTGEIFNFGQIPYPPKLVVYRSNRSGEVIQKSEVPTRGLNFIHDCVIAGKYFIVFEFPTKVNLPLVFFGLSCLSDAMSWKPELGTNIYIFDRNDLSLVSKINTDPFYGYHFSNGYEEKNGRIYLEISTYGSYEHSWKYNKDISLGAAGCTTSITNDSKLVYLRIDAKAGKVLERGDVDGDRAAEFPTVSDHQVGKDWRYTMYLTAPKREVRMYPGEWFKSIARLDRKSQKVEVCDLGDQVYASEPILISGPKDPEHGYVITPVFDADKDTSELWIHDTNNFEGDAVCKIQIPGHIPLSFHGKYQPLASQ